MKYYNLSDLLLFHFKHTLVYIIVEQCINKDPSATNKCVVRCSEDGAFVTVIISLSMLFKY